MQPVLITLLIISLLLDVFLVALTSTRTDRKRTASFGMLCILLMVYTLGYLTEVMSTNVEAAMSALRVENFAIPMIAPFLLLSTLSLFKPSAYSSKYIAYVVAYGMIFFFIVLFNDYHHLYYTSVEMYTGEGPGYLMIGRGSMFYVNQAVFVFCMAATYALLLSRLKNGSKKLRKQMVSFVIGTSFGILAYALSLLRLIPPGLDLMPFAMTLGLGLFSVSLIRSDLMDVVVRATNFAVENMEDAFIVLDAEASFLSCNNSAAKLFPELEQLWETGTIYDLPNWPRDSIDLDREAEVVFDIQKGEDTAHYSARVRKIYNNAKKPIGVSVHIRDITTDRHVLDQMEHMATTDFLTGILNRRKVFELAHRDLEMMKRSGQTAALIMFDLDHFKKVNDKYGHVVGDKVLKETAAAVKSQLRVYDIFGRIGGEEFLIFTYSPGREFAKQFAERIRKTIANVSVDSGKGIIRYTASFGVAEVLPGGKWQDALAAVDVALYKAKNSGRNRVVLSADPIRPPEGEEPEAEDELMFEFEQEQLQLQEEPVLTPPQPEPAG